jgi:hypothetical protein
MNGLLRCFFSVFVFEVLDNIFECDALSSNAEDYQNMTLALCVIVHRNRPKGKWQGNREPQQS